MNSQLWSWVLTAIGLLGFYLISRKVWWAWYINLANQMVWLAYSIVTKQWGFLIGVLAYTVIFGQAAYKWTKEHRAKPKWTGPIGHITGISVDHKGMTAEGVLSEEYMEYLRKRENR